MPLRFILTTSWEDGIADLTARLITELRAGKRVLWLLSGGSNIRATVEVMDSIDDSLTPNLSLLLADERFGPVGHPDSNWQQLLDAGFTTKQSKPYEILAGQANLQAATKDYAQLASEALSRADLVIAQLGIGEDGHILGILPGSIAVDSDSLVCGYDSGKLHRLTLTAQALPQINSAYVFAFGDGKQSALTKLRRQKVSPDVQPAQLLKQIPEVYIYNDQVGG
jgi:6-phosphogluconolactonase/glucosamine-6-phosphate isomerase/deaminase